MARSAKVKPNQTYTGDLSLESAAARSGKETFALLADILKRACLYLLNWSVDSEEPDALVSWKDARLAYQGQIDIAIEVLSLAANTDKGRADYIFSQITIIKGKLDLFEDWFHSSPRKDAETFTFSEIIETLEVLVMEAKDAANGIAFKNKTKELDATPLDSHNPIVKGVSSPTQLRELLERSHGVQPGVILTESSLKLISETAFNAVIAGVIANPGTFRDPVTRLELPPKPRDTDFQCRRKGPSGKRMTYADYLADTEIGWGQYTTHHLITSSWINELDRNLYLALMYQSNKEADESGVPNDHIRRTAAHDEFFLRHGILSPGHLENPPMGYERQATTLTFATKLALELPKGRRPRTER